MYARRKTDEENACMCVDLFGFMWNYAFLFTLPVRRWTRTATTST